MNRFLIAAALAATAFADQPCCKACDESAGLVKYYSIDKLHNMCGECCMKPSDYPKYHLFEPGLKAANSSTPCDDMSYPTYDSTVTHGFGPIKMTLDLYKPTSLGLDPPSGTFCGSLIGIIKENMTVHGDGTFDYFNDVSIAKVHVACTGEKFVWDGSGTMDISANLADPNDCLTKSTASDKKSVPSFSWDGSKIASKNGYGTIKMKPC